MARILMIEDDEDLRAALAEILRDEGHDVCEASDGEEGLKELDCTLPDLVISDLVMDGMEGIETIMSISQSFGDVPILTISGNAIYLRHSEKLGASSSLLKPFTVQQFLGKITELLSGSKSTSAAAAT